MGEAYVQCRRGFIAVRQQGLVGGGRRLAAGVRRRAAGVPPREGPHGLQVVRQGVEPAEQGLAALLQKGPGMRR